MSRRARLPAHAAHRRHPPGPTATMREWILGRLRLSSPPVVRMSLRSGGALVLVVLLAAAALYWRWPARSDDTAPSADDWFADVTDAVGLDFRHDAGELGLYRMPQIVGSG